jgi:hypothetical protein
MGAEMERGEGWVRCRGVGFFVVTLEVLAGLGRGRAGRWGEVGLVVVVVEGSSPRWRAARTAGRREEGMRAWMEVMRAAWREKAE